MCIRDRREAATLAEITSANSWSSMDMIFEEARYVGRDAWTLKMDNEIVFNNTKLLDNKWNGILQGTIHKSHIDDGDRDMAESRRLHKAKLQRIRINQGRRRMPSSRSPNTRMSYVYARVCWSTCCPGHVRLDCGPICTPS